MNTAIVTARFRPSFLVSIYIGLMSASSLAHADVVTISPTAPSANIVDQILNSAATLLEFQEAVVNGDQPYPGAERTIQLEAGLYDFSAVVIPFESIPEPVPAALQQLLDDSYTLGIEDVYWFNPLGLPDPVVLGANGHGVAIYHREHLAISGASLEYGEQPTTIISGNESIYDRGNIFVNLASTYNVGFTVADSSNHITIEQITFQNFMTHLQITSNGNVGVLPPNVPFHGNGTDDVTVQYNRFEVDRVQGIGIFGRNHRLSLLNNAFVTTPGLPFPSGWLVINTVGIGTHSGIGHLVDFLVEGNILENCLSCIRIFDTHDGTVIRNNYITVRSTQEYLGEAIFQIATSHGIPPTFPPTQRGVIEDNVLASIETADPAMKGVDGIIGWGGFDWIIADNEISGLSRYGIWLEWSFAFLSDGSFKLIPQENTVVSGNTVTDSGDTGIFLGAYFRNGAIFDNEFALNTADIFMNDPDGPFLGRGFFFGRVSGTDVVVNHPDEVVNISGCVAGPGGCPQTDYDSDGSVSDDGIDGIDNDNDGLIDEDPIDGNNHISVMLCHVKSGKTMTVPLHSARSHLNHGDLGGACNGE